MVLKSAEKHRQDVGRKRFLPVWIFRNIGIGDSDVKSHARNDSARGMVSRTPKFANRYEPRDGEGVNRY